MIAISEIKGYVFCLLVGLSFIFSPIDTIFLSLLVSGIIFIFYEKFSVFALFFILIASIFFIININFNYFYSFKNTFNLVCCLIGLLGWYVKIKSFKNYSELPLVTFRNILIIMIIFSIPKFFIFSDSDGDRLNGIFAQFLNEYSIDSFKHSMSILFVLFLILSFHKVFSEINNLARLFNLFCCLLLFPFVLSSRSIIFAIIVSLIFFLLKKFRGHRILVPFAFAVLQFGVFYFSLDLEYGDLDGFRDVMYPAAAQFSLDNLLGAGSFAGSEYLRSGFSSDLSLVPNTVLYSLKQRNIVGFESGFFTLIFNHGVIFGNLLFFIFFVIIERVKYDSGDCIEFATANTLKIMFLASFFSFHLFQPYFYGIVLLFLWIKANKKRSVTPLIGSEKINVEIFKKNM